MANSDYNFPVNIDTARYDDDVQAVLSALERRTLPTEPIAFYGSSSFRLWHNMAFDLNSLNAVNLGFGGGTNASASYYIDTLLTPLKPKKIVLYFGENDISNDGLAACTAFENFKTLHGQMTGRFPQVPVYFLSAKQSPSKWIYADVVVEFNHLVAQYCALKPGLSYVNVTDTLLGENGRPISGCYIQDGVHLNPAGYARWAKILQSTPNLLS